MKLICPRQPASPARGIAFALLATTSLSFGAMGAAPAYAQQAVSYDIPAGPLPTVLNQFARQAHVELIYDAPLTQSATSSGLKGSYGAAEGLSRILAGTGLTYRQTGPNVFTLERAPTADAGAVQLGPVRVTGDKTYRVPSQAMIGNLPPEAPGGQVATGGQVGILGNVSDMDTPFNQTNYTAEYVQNVQAQTLHDALIDDPSVRFSSAPNSGNVDTFDVRGFRISNTDVLVGGVFGISSMYDSSTINVERIEVLKGQSALLYGLSLGASLGGAINLVPKRADDKPFTQLTASYLNDTSFGGHIDIGRRFGPNGEFGIRFNGAYTNGNTEVRHQKNRLGVATVGLDYGGGPLRLSIDAGYQDHHVDRDSVQDYFFDSLSTIDAIPKAPNGRLLASQPWTYQDRQAWFALGKAEFDLADNVTLYGAYGRSNTHQDSLIAQSFMLNSAGDTEYRGQRVANRQSESSAQFGVRSQFDTGPIAHKLALEGTRVTQVNYLGWTIGSQWFPSNIYNPVQHDKPDLDTYNIFSDPIALNTKVRLGGVAFADTISAFDDRLLLTSGIRWQEVNTRSYDTETGDVVDSYKSQAWTPAFGLVVKPRENISLYANYIEGLQPGAVVPVGYANAGTVFPPYKSEQYEAGIKIDWGPIKTTFSAFRIAQPSQLVSPTQPLPTVTLDGEQVNRGLELNVSGQITPKLRLLGGAMLVDPRLRRTVDSVNNGKVAPGVPRFQSNLAAEWDAPFIPGLTLTGRITYTGSQYLREGALFYLLPSATTFDTGARFTFDRAGARPVTLRFNVNNLLNKSYWTFDGLSNCCLVASRARTFALSATFDF